MTFVLALALATAACGDAGSTENGDGEVDPTSATNSETPPQTPTGDDICDRFDTDPAAFGLAIGREGLQPEVEGPAERDFFNVDGLQSCSVRFHDPAQANRNDGFTVWAMPAAGATAQQLADGVVSMNPGSLRSESDASGFIAVFSGDLYLGMAGSDSDTSAYAQINPRLETPDLLISLVQSALDE